MILTAQVRKEKAMTTMTNTMRLAMAIAMVAGSMASAQSTVTRSMTVVVPGVELQANVAVNVGFQGKDDVFGDTQKFANGASEVTEINLDPSTMGLVGAKEHGKDGEMARKMKMMMIHTYRYDKPGMYRMEDLDAYRKKLDSGSWSCSIRVRSPKGSTDICSRTSGDKETNEMVIMTAEPMKLTFIHMSGNMSLDELDDMSSSANRFDRRVTPSYHYNYTPPPPPVPPVAPRGRTAPTPSAQPAPAAQPAPPSPPST
jgi:hypothetical protein